MSKLLKPQMNTDEHRFLTEKIIACAMNVSNTLGSGFLEKVYENALAIELRKTGLTMTQQRAVRIFYEGFVVGDYMADLIVNSNVIVELKAAKVIDTIHEAQMLKRLII
jgi:GxxExxY protein